MAGRNHRLLKQTYRLFSNGEGDAPAAAAGDEFDESDVWGSACADGGGADRAGSDPSGKPRAALQGSRGAPRKPAGRGAVAASLPVNIPDWSKILRDGCVAKRASGGGDRWDDDEGDDGEEGEGAVVPPHEYLWRKRGAVASFSVHEGVGRTLKGRDLSRVRNAVWRQTGFQD